MKILHIITDLFRGGAETMLYKLVEALPIGSGFEHSIISMTDVNMFDFDSMGVEVVNLGMRRRAPSLNALRMLRKTVRFVNPDLIQGWMYHGNIAASFAALHNIPVVYGIHHSLNRLGEEKILTRILVSMGARLASLQVSRVVFCSETSRIQHEAVGYPAFKSEFIPNGFDCRRFLPVGNAKHNARQMVGIALPEDSLVAGHVARYHPMKNHVGIIYSFAEVVKLHPQAHLVMIGHDVTPDNLKLQKAINAAGLEGSVHLLGERSDIDRVMPVFDIYLSGSWGEAFPLVLGEAMSCGVPCIATNVGDSAALVGNTGRIVPPGNEPALSYAINEMFAMPAEVRQALGEAARKRVLAEFSLPVVAERYATLYRMLSCASRND